MLLTKSNLPDLFISTLCDITLTMFWYYKAFDGLIKVVLPLMRSRSVLSSHKVGYLDHLLNLK